jgi:hypothetical protein
VKKYSIIIFLASLLMPSVYTEHDMSLGYQLIMVGAIASILMLIFDPLNYLNSGIVYWLANFPLIISWLSKKEKTIKITATISILIAITFSLEDSCMLGWEGGGPTETKILKLGIGYYCWVLSMILAFLSANEQANDQEE